MVNSYFIDYDYGNFNNIPAPQVDLQLMLPHNQSPFHFYDQDKPYPLDRDLKVKNRFILETSAKQ